MQILSPDRLSILSRGVVLLSPQPLSCYGEPPMIQSNPAQLAY
jgi:hypothetical protein